MAKKAKTNYYFESFPELFHHSVICGEMILEFMKDFKHEELESFKDKVHLVEREADVKKHEVTAKLMEEFLPPIDREDILSLLTMLDDVTDAVEEVSLRLFLYDYKKLPEDSIPLMELTVNCLKTTETMLRNFHSFLDVDVIKPLIAEVVKFEEASDTEYIADVSKLYRTEKDPLWIRKCETIYSLLENISDQCREVCKFIQTIIYKNI